jgi:hypothetical protein
MTLRCPICMSIVQVSAQRVDPHLDTSLPRQPASYAQRSVEGERVTVQLACGGSGAVVRVQT